MARAAPALVALALLAALAGTHAQYSTLAVTNSNLQRKNLNASDFFFDLSKIRLKSSSPRELGGGNDGAVAFTVQRPSLLGYGISQARVNLLPCGINTPHIHPRGTELLYVINGNVTAGFVEENGGRVITNQLSNFQTTFFPMGLLHWYQNTGCSVAEVTAVFNADDPGTTTAAVALARLPTDVVSQSFGIDPETAAALTVGLNDTIADNYFAEGTAECLAKCGL